MPGYNIMGVAKAALEASVRYLALELGAAGVRVNAISAGSVRTPAAQAVPGFAERLAAAEKKSPLAAPLPLMRSLPLLHFCSAQPLAASPPNHHLRLRRRHRRLELVRDFRTSPDFAIPALPAVAIVQESQK